MKIPVALITPIIDKYLEEEGFTSEEAGHGVIDLLCRNTGLEQRALWRYRMGEAQTMSLEIADRLLCAMDKVELWRHEPLLTYYWAGDVPPDMLKPLRCANPLCDEWIDREVESSHKVFCSTACRQRASTRRLGKHRTRSVECRNGHKRATTTQRVNHRTGQTDCMKCYQAATARFRARKRAGR